uniref:Uncharacterized protein n=1 Tax=Romanomermis culicivorax TaxID=13658 RepID=A0A915HGG9_ROMCU
MVAEECDEDQIDISSTRNMKDPFQIPSSSAYEIQRTGPTCEFDSDLQGTYRIQDDTSKSTARRRPKAFSSLTSSFQQREPVKYKDLFIGPTSIPQWGDCSRKNSSRYVLGSKQGSVGYCYRCFLIVQRTPNILQVINNDESACFPTIAIAQRSCADREKISAHEGTFLWRSENVHYQFCPVGGRANITYSLNRRTYCPFPVRLPSTIDNCQLGYRMDVTLNSCFFPIPDNFQMSLKCLGSWDAGRSGETFFAVYNSLTDEFRCGLFRDDRRRYGYATAALSNDSSCSSMLNSSTSGFETFTLFSDMDFDNVVGTKLSTFKAQCSFPKWLQADDWDTLMIIRDGLIDFYDQNNPDTMIKIKGKCHSIMTDDLPAKAIRRISTISMFMV